MDFIPEEIVLNILSRLPVEDIMRCRCVRKGWRDLTLTRDFFDIRVRQRPGNFPLVLVETRHHMMRADYYFIKFEHYLMKRWWEPVEASQDIRRLGDYSDYLVELSHDGLLVLRKRILPGDVIILNPVTSENVRIILPEDMMSFEIVDKLRRWEIYGVFFHPLVKEYCMLWGKNISNGALEPLVQFKMLILGSKPCWRDIGNPMGGKGKIQGTFPVLVHEHLYWMVKPEEEIQLIMEFDIKHETFTVIPSPPDAVPTVVGAKKLLNIDGRLSVVLTGIVEKLLITIWTLKDHLREFQTSHHLIDTNGYEGDVILEAIAAANGVIFLRSLHDVFVCNLKQESVHIGSNNFDGLDSLWSYEMTVASLRNIKSMIYLDEKQGSLRYIGMTSESFIEKDEEECSAPESETVIEPGTRE